MNVHRSITITALVCITILFLSRHPIGIDFRITVDLTPNLKCQHSR